MGVSKSSREFQIPIGCALAFEISLGFIDPMEHSDSYLNSDLLDGRPVQMKQILFRKR